MTAVRWGRFFFIVPLLTILVGLSRFGALPFASDGIIVEEFRYVLTILFLAVLLSTMGHPRIVMLTVFVMTFAVSMMSQQTSGLISSGAEWLGVVRFLSYFMGESVARFFATLTVGLLIAGLGMAIGAVMRAQVGIESAEGS